MPRDRRYSSRRWRRLRHAVIVRDGGYCQVRGLRCTTIATTAHHIRPSSLHPELFWDPENLQAACRPCNLHGAAVRAEKRVTRQELAYLEELVEVQEEEIARLTARLARYGNGGYGGPDPERREPRIY
jgi:5-methylcytosine-specific restriction endonuclease McrA